LTAPFVVGVTEVLRHPGTQREIEVAGELAGLEISTARVPVDAEVRARLTLEAQSDHALTATGTISAPWHGECRRCLRDIEGELRADVQEVFDTHPIEGETYPLTGDRVDLEPMIRDAVLLALPLAPLCEEGCEGPEPEHHPLGDAGEPEADPRWSALGELKFE
jgi:uncharacterized protein